MPCDLQQPYTTEVDSQLCCAWWSGAPVQKAPVQIHWATHAALIAGYTEFIQGRLAGDGQGKHNIAAQGSPLQPMAPLHLISGDASSSQWKGPFHSLDASPHVRKVLEVSHSGLSVMLIICTNLTGTGSPPSYTSQMLLQILAHNARRGEVLQSGSADKKQVCQSNNGKAAIYSFRAVASLCRILYM